MQRGSQRFWGPVFICNLKLINHSRGSTLLSYVQPNDGYLLWPKHAAATEFIRNICCVWRNSCWFYSDIVKTGYGSKYIIYYRVLLIIIDQHRLFTMITFTARDSVTHTRLLCVRVGHSMLFHTRGYQPQDTISHQIVISLWSSCLVAALREACRISVQLRKRAAIVNPPYWRIQAAGPFCVNSPPLLQHVPHVWISCTWLLWGGKTAGDSSWNLRVSSSCYNNRAPW
jgi:hypothetical protein